MELHKTLAIFGIFHAKARWGHHHHTPATEAPLTRHPAPGVLDPNEVLVAATQDVAHCLSGRLQRLRFKGRTSMSSSLALIHEIHVLLATKDLVCDERLQAAEAA